MKGSEHNRPMSNFRPFFSFSGLVCLKPEKLKKRPKIRHRSVNYALSPSIIVKCLRRICCWWWFSFWREKTFFIKKKTHNHTICNKNSIYIHYLELTTKRRVLLWLLSFFCTNMLTIYSIYTSRNTETTTTLLAIQCEHSY